MLPLLPFIIIAVVVIFIGILLIRAISFKPYKTEQCAIRDTGIDSEQEKQIINNLSRMIQCKTVSSADSSLTDKAEFEKFRTLLAQLYPEVHRACVPERISETGILFKYKGKNSSAPVVLMSHYDVVPANEEAWEKPAFGGVFENGYLWGRGTLDTKGTLCGVMEAAERLLKRNFVPENDLYFAFSGDEEISGPSAPAMVEELKKRGISPAMVLDEGGAVVQGAFPGIAKPCALIGIAEKGLLDVELSLETEGGHASAPPPHTPVGQLAQAAVRIENHPFKSHLPVPVAKMFDILGRHSTFFYKVLFANLWCFFPVLDAMCRKSGGELNAMMRTTCAFTMMEGSKATNVIPPVAKMRANLRLMDGETYESAIEYLKSVAKDPKIQFKAVYAMNPSNISEASGHSWEHLKNAIAQTWPDALISPYLMTACSDSRHYDLISNNVYRFSAMFLSKEERGMIHGNNERISAETIIKIVQFYLRLMEIL